MSLLVWKGSLGKPLLREGLAGCAAEADAPERAPVMAGVAFLEDAAAVWMTVAARFMLVCPADVAVRPAGEFGSLTGVARDSAVGADVGSRAASAAGVAPARTVPARGVPPAFVGFCLAAAPVATRGFCALARGSLLVAFPAGARGAI
ncbi:hypothetical protein [Paraburkholderia tropica]|uniref:hypothetical protein n=1 Tax=Paraburkholderia tropica TaxID=92647 RepID=UPI001CC66154|nr:hypothetical protein [Paraburkholderia tropica]